MNSLSTAIQELTEKKVAVYAMSGADAVNVPQSEALDQGNQKGGEDEPDPKAKWILPVILLALLGVFMWYWLNHDNEAKEAAADNKDKVEMSNTADSIANAMNAELKEGAAADSVKAKTEESK